MHSADEGGASCDTFLFPAMSWHRSWMYLGGFCSDPLKETAKQFPTFMEQKDQRFNQDPYHRDGLSQNLPGSGSLQGLLG